MCLWWKLLKGEADFALHRLGGKVAGLHVPLQKEELVRHLPGMDLEGETEERGREIRLWWKGGQEHVNYNLIRFRRDNLQRMTIIWVESLPFFV